MDDELAGDGTLILDGESIATVYYWLTVVPKPGVVIAEGSITGSEDVMRKIKKATAAKLALVDAFGGPGDQDSGRKSYRCRSLFRVVVMAYWMRIISAPSRVKT